MSLEAITDRLVAAGCVAAREEAAELLAAAPDPATLEQWVGARERGTPLAWIVGATTFAGRRLAIGAGVYVPRVQTCLLYTSPSPRDGLLSRMPSSA